MQSYKLTMADYFGSGMDNIFILLVFKLLHLQQTNKEPNII